MAASPLLRGAPTPHRTPLAPHSGVRSVLGQVPTSRTPQRPLVSGLLPLPSPQIPYTAAHLLPQCQTRSAMGAPPPPRQQPSHPPTDRIADSLDTLTALVSSFGQRLSALELQSTSHAASLPMPVLPSHVPYPHDPTPYTAAPLPAQTPVAPAAAPPGTCGPMPHHGPPSAATLPTTQHQIATELRHQLSHLGIDSSSDPEEDTRPKTRKSCRLKSGNVRATHDYVVKKMPWPHIGVFQAQTVLQPPTTPCPSRNLYLGTWASYGKSRISLSTPICYITWGNSCRMPSHTHGKMCAITMLLSWPTSNTPTLPGRTGRQYRNCGTPTPASPLVPRQVPQGSVLCLTLVRARPVLSGSRATAAIRLPMTISFTFVLGDGNTLIVHISTRNRLAKLRPERRQKTGEVNPLLPAGSRFYQCCWPPSCPHGPRTPG